MKELGSLTWTDYQLQKELEFCVKDHYIMGSRGESDQGSVTLCPLMWNKVRVLLAFVCATRDFFMHAALKEVGMFFMDVYLTQDVSFTTFSSIHVSPLKQFL